MENKTIALQLGLPETATDAEISAKLAELSALKEQNESLLKEKESLTLVNITSLVTQAIAEKRLEEKDKDQFVELGKKIGQAELEKTLKAMHPAVKLSEVPADQIATLRSESHEEYKRLYKAEYGIECEI
jgi:hypothetical protein